jgi:hypothetical protein
VGYSDILGKRGFQTLVREWLARGHIPLRSANHPRCRGDFASQRLRINAQTISKIAPSQRDDPAPGLRKAFSQSVYVRD